MGFINKKDNKLKQEISGLKSALQEKDRFIDDLEICIEMYERVIEMSRKELLNANATVKAQGVVSEMTRQELMNRDNIIDALQSILDYSSKKRREEKSINEAWKAVIDLAGKERRDAEKIINALQNVEDFSARESKRKDLEIKALQDAINSSQGEKQAYEEIIHAYSRIQALADAEKLQILKMLNKRIRFDYENLKNNIDFTYEE
ncbi:MAG: hypothetical protein JW864_09480 [Spirochaetes bacterium]|nr:hypothetical protein [Spirochaetota bacterium]